MENTAYYLYVQEVISFVRNLVIKSEQSIELSNRFLKQAGYDSVNYANHIDFKYYQHLQGNYFSGTDTDPTMLDDEMMYFEPFDIIPVDMERHPDDSKLVPFTRATLDQLPISRSELLTRGSYFRDLTNKYLDRELLIKGILNPLSEEQTLEIIASPDLTIINYDTTFVGENETTVIPKIQSWIYLFGERWNNKDYQISDKLYTAGFINSLYSNLVPHIISVHYENCKTPFVNKFHMWSHLGGYFNLDMFRNRLPIKQAVWLYRNIDDITNNGGNAETLEFINREFAEPNGLLLSRYDLLKTNDGNVEVGRTPLYGSSINPTDDIISLDDFMEKNRYNGTGNKKYEDDIKDNILRKVTYNARNELRTSVFECNVRSTDSLALVSERLERFQHWLYYANIDRYLINKSITIPSVGIITLDPKEAVAVAMYCAAKLNNNTKMERHDQMPILRAGDVFTFDDTVTVANLEDGVELKYRGYLDAANLVAEAEALWADASIFFTTDDFLNYIKEVSNFKAKCNLLTQKPADAKGKVQIEMALRKLFRMQTITKFSKHGTNLTWGDFMDSIEFDLDQVSYNNLDNLMKQVIKEFIDFNTLTNAIPSPYYEMIEIVKILVSYNTSLVPGDRVTPFDPIDWVFLSHADPDVVENTDNYLFKDEYSVRDNTVVTDSVVLSASDIIIQNDNLAVTLTEAITLKPIDLSTSSYSSSENSYVELNQINITEQE